MRSRVLLCRLFSTRILALLLLMLGFGAYCYYYTTSPQNYVKPRPNMPSDEDLEFKAAPLPEQPMYEEPEPSETCPSLSASVADIDTVAVFPTFEFQPSWLRTKEFWDKSFEERYERLRNDSRRPRLKVIVAPHSHNDPGWLKTFEQYFEWKSKEVINNVVAKLQQYPNMTFMWTEISLLHAWWERAHPVKQKALKKLVKEGRLEITTGGWVMPDEACTHMYALIDQFIEGHSWVKNNLGVSPRTGWSIDPFGHGPTVPYLLDRSGLEGTVIQRIHYAWKQWLAKHQVEEFHWLPSWAARSPSLVVHNQPFDIYSIKSSCGPHPSVCLGYDFRKVPGEYTEYTAKQEEITEQNLHAKSKTLLEEYERIGSLTPHNVVLVPLGDDFRYELAAEFDAQYTNYMKMFGYINSHPELFNADVRFGTPLDFFLALRERHAAVPTLKGDFFVYSEIFSEGKPAYWSGYYTTRPYVKILDRQLQHHLRAAEILFTLVFNHLRQGADGRLEDSLRRLEKSYEHLVYARRNMGLFQHHDAITGTSKAGVMHDYGTKLLTSLNRCLRLQETALAALMLPDPALHGRAVLQSELEYERYGAPPRRLPLSGARRSLVVFNSLAQPRVELVSVRVDSPHVRVRDARDGRPVPHQLAPRLERRADGRRVLSRDSFDLMFVARLPALAAVTFHLEEHEDPAGRCVVFCNNCTDAVDGDPAIFVVNKMMPGDVQLENSALKLLVDRNTGFLRQIYRKDERKKNVVEVQFGAYQSAQRHSGAYLFLPDYDAPEKDVLRAYAGSGAQDDNIVIVSGPLATEVTAMYLPFLAHTARIYNADELALQRAVYLDTRVDFGNPPRNRETELFMRVQTDIENGDVPEFYTDQNGFQYQKRVKVAKLGVEANYYPITTMAWLQDEETRLTLVTTHAQGAAAFEPGRLEVMLDRRTLYDDFRGMGEGVVDNRPTRLRHWLLLEPTPPAAAPPATEPAPRPTRAADALSRALSYPPVVHLIDASDAPGGVRVHASRELVHAFPRDVHLVSLRSNTDPDLDHLPAPSALLVLSRPASSCGPATFSGEARFAGVRVRNVSAVSLTGLRTLHRLSGLRDIRLEPMDVKTFEVHF